MNDNNNHNPKVWQNGYDAWQNGYDDEIWYGINESDKIPCKCAECERKYAEGRATAQKEISEILNLLKERGESALWQQ